jgi:hypothetical protein
MRRALGRIAGCSMLVVAVVALAGCAAVGVSSYQERGLDLRQYRTYAWGPADAFSTGDPRLDNNRFFDEHVRTQVEKELASRGFRKTTSGPPDLLVHYHASFTQDIAVRDIDRRYLYCTEGDSRPYAYDAGTLLVDLVDARTSRLAWRGWAEGSVEGAIDDQESMESRIDAAVSRILERLPRRL